MPVAVAVAVVVASYLVKILVEVVASSSCLVVAASYVVVAYLDVQEEEALACCTVAWVVSWACLLQLLLVIGEEEAFPSSWAFLVLVAVVGMLVAAAADMLAAVDMRVDSEEAVAVAVDGELPIDSFPAAEMMMMKKMMMPAALHSIELVSTGQQEA